VEEAVEEEAIEEEAVEEEVVEKEVVEEVDGWNKSGTFVNYSIIHV
jgi:hypothetical protein